MKGREGNLVDARCSMRIDECVGEPILLCGDDTAVVSAVLDADGNLFAAIKASAGRQQAE